MPQPFCPDERLVAAALHGCDHAWVELVRQHRLPLVRALAARIGDAEAAQDLAQRAFLVAWRRLDRMPLGVPFMAWLRGIARYEVLTYQRERARDHLSLEAAVERVGDVFEDSGRGDPAPAFAVCEVVNQTLASLSPLLCEALLLREVRGLTAREIAAHLGITLTAAERRCGRAVAEFRLRYPEVSDGARNGHAAGLDSVVQVRPSSAATPSAHSSFPDRPAG